ncbi:MAG: diacylglycerol kinase family lipid kinase [Arthrobacter sp.]|jgi:diacylglycerol kinase family enzyme|nr:diacylglycerol kinase family lipid kinase [Arthrobacter sp.]
MPSSSVVAVVINPVKTESARARELLRAACAEAGRAEPLFFETSQEDAGHAMAREALDRGAGIVIACGGDGTVRAVAEELIGAEGVELSILPLGTGNLLARNLGIDVDDLEAAAAVAVGRQTDPVDALRITLLRPDRSSENTISVVASGVGLDAEVMNQTKEGLKKVVGPAAYAATGVTKMLGLRRHPVRISVDDGAWETERARTVLLVNAGYIQGGLQYVPGSRHDDGVQDAVVMSPRSLAGWGVVAAKMLLRLQQDVPVISYRSGARLAVRTFYPVQAQVDGDPVGEVTELESQILPHALRVHVPREEDRLQPGGPLAKILPASVRPRRLWPRVKERAASLLPWR